MMALWEIYWLSWIVSAGAGLTLSCLGLHMTSRLQSLQSLSVGQAATFGVLLGIVFFHDHHHSGAAVLTGVGTALLVFYGGKKWAIRRPHLKESFFIALFLFMMAASYWLISFFPGIDGHLAQAYFGDLVTVSTAESWVIIALSVLMAAWLFCLRKTHLKESLEVSLYGEEDVRRCFHHHIFEFLSVIYLSVCIFSLGFLFTIASLLIPTVWIGIIQRSSLQAHVRLIGMSVLVASFVGFWLSLRFDQVSTTPSIVLSYVFAGGILTICFNLYRSLKGKN